MLSMQKGLSTCACISICVPCSSLIENELRSIDPHVDVMTKSAEKVRSMFAKAGTKAAKSVVEMVAELSVLNTKEADFTALAKLLKPLICNGKNSVCPISAPN